MMADTVAIERLGVSEEALRQFCERWLIKELELFGSALRGDLRDDSDIDLLATWQDSAAWSLFDHMDMEDELAALFGRKVDLVSRSVIEESDNPFRRKDILGTARRFYAA